MLRFALVLLLVLMAAPARADLIGDARRVVSAWSGSTSSASHIGTVFLQDGETRRVGFVDKRNQERACMTVVAIAERHVRFTLSTAAATEPAESRAGVARIVDCGGGSLSLGAARHRVELKMVKGRGAIEVIAATYATLLTPVEVAIPERAEGPVGVDEANAGPLTLRPLAERMARARRLAELDGASRVAPLAFVASREGVGSIVTQLAAGCHRLHVAAEVAPGQTADVDAEVRHNDDGSMLVRDRSHAPDARLAFCLGESTLVELRFTGAPSAAKMTLLDASWRMPEAVPSAWGPTARAGIWWSMFRRHAPRPYDAPIFESLGAPGTTVLPVEVEPGACYLATFSLARGSANSGRLIAIVGQQQVYDDAHDAARSAAVTFCAGSHDQVARILVDLRARDAWWVAVVWRLGASGG